MGKGSINQDEELRYSLRALCKNMLDLNKLIVVGHKPDFLTGVQHIACEDNHEKPWKNVLEKTRLASHLPGITDEFLLMNDDFFMDSPFAGAEFPFYAVKGGGGGCDGKYDFKIHCPIRFKCDWYNQLPLTLDMKGDWSPRSFYCNFFGAPPTFKQDTILRHGDNMPSFDDQLADEDFFSISNGTMSDFRFKKWLREKYPEPSKFEICSMTTTS